MYLSKEKRSPKIIFSVKEIIGMIIIVAVFVVSIGVILSVVGTYTEVQGTVRDSFIDTYDRGTLVVDSNDGTVEVWYVTDETFANCDTGDLIHRVPDGTVTCSSQDKILTGQ